VRAIPNMKMIGRATNWETRKATVAAADDSAPQLLRFGREPVPW